MNDSNSIEIKMFYGATPAIFDNARTLRKNMTLAEIKLWSRLNKSQMGYRFKPQHPINIFIVDFYCHSLKLVIEVDGEIHLQQIEYDTNRTNQIKNYSIEIIRFTNEEVLRNIENVIEIIKSKIEKITLRDNLINYDTQDAGRAPLGVRGESGLS